MALTGSMGETVLLYFGLIADDLLQFLEIDLFERSRHLLLDDSVHQVSSNSANEKIVEFLLDTAVPAFQLLSDQSVALLDHLGLGLLLVETLLLLPQGTLLRGHPLLQAQLALVFLYQLLLELLDEGLLFHDLGILALHVLLYLLLLLV